MSLRENNPNKVIMHHSATKDGKTLNDFKSICNHHTKVKGWEGPCGYHLVSEYINYGLITHLGRPMNKEGAHCIGQNTNSIGWCLVGNYDKNKPDDKQYEFLAKEYVRLIFPKYGRLPLERHNKYSSTACPGKNFDIDKLNFLINRFDNVVKPKKTISDYDKEIVQNGFDYGVHTSIEYWTKRVIDGKAMLPQESIQMGINIVKRIEKMLGDQKKGK